MGLKIAAALGYLAQSPTIRTNPKARRAYNDAADLVHSAGMAMGSQANWGSDHVQRAEQQVNRAVALLRPFRDASQVVSKANAMLGSIRQLSYTMGDETPGILSVNKSTKNSLTMASRRALSNLSNIANEIQQVEQFDLGQMQRSAPPNTYASEIGMAQRQLSEAYEAVKLAYIQVRRIAKKAGEIHY